MTSTAYAPALPAPDAPWQEWATYGRAWGGGERVTGEPTQIASLRSWPITFHAYNEPTPGPRWRALWEATRSAYQTFYLSEGEAARPSLADCEAALERYMPELVPTWRRLAELTDHDQVAARLLTMWRMPIFAAGCSQIALPGDDPILTRNYDYDPELFEGVIASTNYSGSRAVLGTSDMLWGLVDGMNDAGLAISLTYGGRPGGSAGFAIPLVIRYLLETSTTVAQACQRLRGLPLAQAYNLAMVDTTGAHATVFVAPDSEPEISDLQVSTNHRLGEVEHPDIAQRLSSRERQEWLIERTQPESPHASEVSDWFGQEPLFNDRYSDGFGTLYTVSYRPSAGEATYRWGTQLLTRTFTDEDATWAVVLRGH